MDLSPWKKIKRSGHFKRTVKKKYLQILENCSFGASDEGSSNSMPQVNIKKDSVVDNKNQTDSYDNNVSDTRITHSRRDSDDLLSDMDEDVDTPDMAEEDISINFDSEIVRKIEIKKKLKLWATTYNINHSALKELFTIWNTAIPNLLPQDPRTFLNTPKSLKIISIENGTYWHNGLINNLIVSLENCSISEISLNINIDGLPIYKSSRCEFWPILCNIYEIPEVKPIIIGIYSGKGKPANLNSYLRNFVDEIKQVMNDGIFVASKQGQQKIKVKIRCFICDSPARAFIKGVANFNSKDGCLKCTTGGEYSHISHTVYFPRADCELRTDEGFRNRIYGRHHKMGSPLEELQIDMVEDFPVGDSLHLIDLGIMKRCLTGWKDGNFGSYLTKFSAKDINLVSTFLTNCKMPLEIHRVVRGLDVLVHWKGTEYHTFLMYISIVILKKVLASDVYQHFLTFFCSITICSTKIYNQFLPLAESLLKHYVEMYRDFYGEDYMTSNVHNLTHLVHEVKKFGVLSSFNAYPFENRLYYIKHLLRTGNSPLEQIAKRLGERLGIDRFHNTDLNKKLTLKNADINSCYKTAQFGNFTLSSRNKKDKWFLTSKDQLVSMAYARYENDSITIFGNAVLEKQDYFDVPVKSSLLHIYKSNGDVGQLKKYLAKDIKCKVVYVQDLDDSAVFIPLIHTYSQY